MPNSFERGDLAFSIILSHSRQPLGVKEGDILNERETQISYSWRQGKKQVNVLGIWFEWKIEPKKAGCNFSWSSLKE